MCMLLFLREIASFERCLRGFVPWIIVLLLLCRWFSISGFSVKSLCSNVVFFERPVAPPYPFPTAVNERGDTVAGSETLAYRVREHNIDKAGQTI